ncbi:hypothetical protein [Amaricoccus tamworthensis]|uniref:hypothetical protein n=1 Tax=Amaricoccus tamworthensis TaxID=57002 RepID=UPI003C7A72BD
MPKSILSLSLATGIVFATTGIASAVTWASDGGADDTWRWAGRDNIASAFGSPSATPPWRHEAFFSLGLGGRAWFTFGTPFQGEASVFEVTWGDRSRYPESATIHAGDFSSGLPDDLFDTANYGASWSTVDNAEDRSDFHVAGGPFTHLLFVDTSSNRSGDGFDINAISVTEASASANVPEIDVGAGLGSLAVMGCMIAWLRTRRKQPHT